MRLVNEPLDFITCLSIDYYKRRPTFLDTYVNPGSHPLSIVPLASHNVIYILTFIVCQRID